MASLTDILTSAQNIVTAINGLAQTYLNVQGAKNASNITGATLVKSGGGRVAVVSVTTAGSAPGKIYDSASASATSPAIYSIPDTLGVYVVNLPVSYGIVVAPGSGQVVTVGYS